MPFGRMCLVCLVALWLIGTVGAAWAVEHPATSSPNRRELRVGVVLAPPFVEKNKGGALQGVAIDLWRDIARDLGWEWHAKVYELEELLAAVLDGKVDVGVSALSITPEREGVMDFSQPFYYTGLGIAVPAKHSLERTVVKLVGRFFSVKVMLYVGSLLVLLLLVGAVVWVLERRCNPEGFRPGRKGIGDGMWWSAVTMTSVGYGDAAPKTLAGRAVALVWMFASVALLASFTAGITSLLTVESMGGSVVGVDDLHKARTGVVADSAADEELATSHIGVVRYLDLEEGLAALTGGDLDAFVDDQPLLQYRQHHGFSASIRILPGFFDPQLYGFAFPRGSELRKSVNVTLLRLLEDTVYRQRLFGPYLGKAAAH